jgi:WD40 domain-containing protein
MFDRNLVTSGFDCETLISEKYLRYLVLAQIEAGLLQLVFDFVDPQTQIPVTVTLHPPADDDYQRLYTPSPDAPLPSPVAGSLEMRLVPGEASGFNDVAFAPDGKHLFTRSVDSMIRIWDLDLRTQDDAAAFQVDPGLGSAFNAAGTQVAITAATTNNRKISIWDLQSKTSVKTLTGHTHVVECVAFSPEGQRLASGSFDATVRVWDLTTAGDPLLHTLTGHVGRVIAVAFNHAGTQIVSGGEDGTVRVWDAQTGASFAELSGHTAPVNCVAFSPNDTRVASGSDDKTIRLWDPAAGTTVQTLTGHTDAVLSVDIDVNGTRLLSGSADNTLKLWRTFPTTSVRTITDHRSDVTRVRFSGGPNGRNASVSAGGSIRIWDDIFTFPVKTVELRMDFMHVDVFATIVQHLPTGDQTDEGNMGLFVYLALNADRTPNGLESNHSLRLSFARFDPLTKFALEQANVDVAFVEDQIRSRLDRDLPLGVAQGQQVQQIRMKKYVVPAGQRTLGLYVDLALRAKPGSEFLPSRGILGLAQDFREPTSAIAFATSPGLFALLGPDAKAQRGEKAPGSKDFRFPLREDLSDPDSDEIGTIDGISVGPELPAAPAPPVPTGRLMVNVDATYEESTPDVGIAVQFFFKPKRNADGIVEWESDVDVDLGLLATLLFVVGGMVLLFPFIGPFSITAGLLVSSFAGVIGKAIAEHYAAKAIAEKTDEQGLASVLDALPVRLPAASRRWDPFYLTEHQIVAKLDEPMVIDKKGIAFSAEEIVLDKQPVPREDIAPVGEGRDGGVVSAVRYDVPDFLDFVDDFRPEVTAPGVDRLHFVRSDEVNEPRVVTLTIDEIVERKDDKLRRVLAPIVLDAQRIYMVGGQIDQLLSATWLLRTRHRDRLINEFKRRTRDDINANERAQIEQDVIADLGGGATAEEIAEEVELRIDKLVDDRRKEYIDGALRDDLHHALAPFLRFDLAPEELIELQQKHGIFSLDGKEIIVRHNADGTKTPYYRDRPDGDPRDNLLSLPHYAFPYVPPPAP